MYHCLYIIALAPFSPCYSGYVPDTASSSIVSNDGNYTHAVLLQGYSQAALQTGGLATGNAAASAPVTAAGAYRMSDASFMDSVQRNGFGDILVSYHLPWTLTGICMVLRYLDTSSPGHADALRLMTPPAMAATLCCTYSTV